MTATITVTTGHTYNNDTNFRTAVKAGLAGIGVTAGQIEYDTGSHVICKISSGLGQPITWWAVYWNGHGSPFSIRISKIQWLLMPVQQDT